MLVSINGRSPNGLLGMEHLIKMNDLEVPPVWEAPYIPWFDAAEKLHDAGEKQVLPYK